MGFDLRIGTNQENKLRESERERLEERVREKGLCFFFFEEAKDF